MLTLPPSVRIYVAVEPVDARKSFDGLVALVESEFGLEPLSGHLFAFLNRRGHVAQMIFWDRTGYCIVKN
jgi:transposase